MNDENENIPTEKVCENEKCGKTYTRKKYRCKTRKAGFQWQALCLWIASKFCSNKCRIEAQRLSVYRVGRWTRWHEGRK